MLLITLALFARYFSAGRDHAIAGGTQSSVIFISNKAERALTETLLLKTERALTETLD
jgi:hypothetical protein